MRGADYEDGVPFNFKGGMHVEPNPRFTTTGTLQHTQVRAPLPPPAMPCHARTPPRAFGFGLRMYSWVGVTSVCRTWAECFEQYEPCMTSADVMPRAIFFEKQVPRSTVLCCDSCGQTARFRVFSMTVFLRPILELGIPCTGQTKKINWAFRLTSSREGTCHLILKRSAVHGGRRTSGTSSRRNSMPRRMSSRACARGWARVIPPPCPLCRQQTKNKNKNKFENDDAKCPRFR